MLLLISSHYTILILYLIHTLKGTSYPLDFHDRERCGLPALIRMIIQRFGTDALLIGGRTDQSAGGRVPSRIHFTKRL